MNRLDIRGAREFPYTCIALLLFKWIIIHLNSKHKGLHTNLPGAETGENDGAEASAHDRWSLVLETKKIDGHAGFGLFFLFYWCSLSRWRRWWWWRWGVLVELTPLPLCFFLLSTVLFCCLPLSPFFFLFSSLFFSVFLFLSFTITKGWKKKNLCSPLLFFFVPFFFLPAMEVYVAISSY